MSAAASTLQTHGWWLASRASGLVALVLVTVSVGIGLAMAGKVMRRPGLSRRLLATHEHTALAGLVAIAVHGVTLLGDPWLNPGISGIAIPFAMGFKPLWTGLGVIAGYMAVLLGLSFYARKRIGARFWRKAHRATILVYVLGLAHAFGAGSDASAAWFRWWVAATAPAIAVLFAYRVLSGGAKRSRSRRRAAPRSEPAGPGEPRPGPVPTPRRGHSVSRSPILEEA